MSRLLLACCLVLAACGGGDDDGEPTIAAECNPLGGAGCVTPWPSSVYTVDDDASPTGVRLDLAPGAMPTSADDAELEVAPFNTRTGFSPAAQIFTVFPEGVDPANLPGADDIAASLGDDSPTVILDIESGERVAHFAELDANTDDPTVQALYLRPAARLAGGRHYAVAIRRSLRAAGGGELTRPRAFQQIVDGRSTGHARLDAARPRMDAALAALADAGLATDDLVVAWEFVTADDESILADPRAVRDAVQAALGDGSGITYVVDADQPIDDGSGVVRRIDITFQSPAVAGDDGLFRDGSGAPVVQGSHDAEATIMIPACATAKNRAGILIFGHGFFGNTAEARGGYMRRVARDLCMVVVGGVWWGMSMDDLSFAASALNDLNKALAFGERILQGITDFTTLELLARTALASELLVDDADASIVDPARTYFYGISQGSILGTTFFAWHPTLERAALHVGGANWGVLFERSTNWVTFKLILDGAYPGPLNAVIVQQVLQMGLDPIDPVHVSPFLLEGLGGTVEKHVVQQISVGDAQVSNLASFLQARTMALPVLGPALFVPYGLEEATGPLSDAFVIMTEEPTPLPPATNQLNDQGNAAHGDLRRRDAVVDQIGMFFATGEVVHTCDGPCNCAEGACGELDPP